MGQADCGEATRYYEKEKRSNDPEEEILVGRF
jgi:hypothetical protein